MHKLVKATLGYFASKIFFPKRLVLWVHKIRGVTIDNPKSVLIAPGVIIDLIYPEYIHIEEGVWLTQNCILLAHFRPTTGLAERIGGDRIEPVRIGKCSFIGTSSIILPGVTVGEYAVVGAGSVVTKNVPAFTVVAGNPARVIKKVDEIPT